MHPAFRSLRSAAAFCLLLVCLLTLPMILALIGLPPRPEVYKQMTTAGGNDVGQVLSTLNPANKLGDVVFLGSSLVESGIDPDVVRSALTQHLKRKVKDRKSVV